MIVERPTVSAIVVDEHRRRRCTVSMPPGADGLLLARLIAIERERQVADFQPIAVGEPMRGLDLLAVDERAVAAVQVFDEILAVDPSDLRVLPADGAGIEHDIAIRMPAHDGPPLGKLHLFADVGSGKNFQDSHRRINQRIRRTACRTAILCRGAAGRQRREQRIDVPPLP